MLRQGQSEQAQLIAAAQETRIAARSLANDRQQPPLRCSYVEHFDRAQLQRMEDQAKELAPLIAADFDSWLGSQGDGPARRLSHRACADAPKAVLDVANVHDKGPWNEGDCE